MKNSPDLTPNDVYWEPALETLPEEELKALQLERLKEVINRAASSPFYQKVFKEYKVDPAKIRSLDDLRRIPFTTKEDLRQWYPYGFLTVPKEKLVRMHSSSGTTGKPTVVFYTRRDLDSWANLVARCMYMTGVRPGDVFQNMMGYGLFTGGLGFHYGAEKIGCLVIPAGPGNTKRQLFLMREFETTVVHIIPSYALYVAEVCKAEGIDPKKEFKLRIAFIGAEPHAEGIRQRIEDFFGIDAFNSYGLSEVNGPGVAFECPYKQGMHLWEDAYIVEIIDPETLEPVPEGEEGELVLTTLTREGMPILRYRTRDLTRIVPGKCPCGRTHKRIARITGRTDDMLIIKGVNIYPIQIERVLMDLPEVGSNYLIEVHKKETGDKLSIKVEVKNDFFYEDMRYLEKLRKKIGRKVREEILVTPKVELVEPNSLPRTEGKAKRVIIKENVNY
ncbi:MAG: phenylacetate--CoA ligase [Candidatus Desulfofervidaceae bacterium]|nr:phenylacetate--CoA ligase [Candidatus Desulfofervidaceae bacterium]